MNLCSLSEIKALSERHGFSFSKSLGQNFLTAKEIPAKIAAAAGVDRGFGILEVGPGVGALTVELAALAGRVCAVELDRTLLPLLSETLAGLDNVSVVNGDILKVDLHKIAKDQLPGLRLAAAANLPYYITTPAITVLLESGLFESVTVMVQKEVARRLCAAPGTPDYGSFTVFIAYYSRAKTVLNVPAGCFYPVPKVDSAVVRLEVLREPPVATEDRDFFFNIVRAAFGQRRKTLKNALGAYIASISDNIPVGCVLENAGIDPVRRGETLSIEEFAHISNALFNALYNI